MRTMVLLMAALCAAPAWGDDWPTFRGPRRDGQSAEAGLLKAWPRRGPTKLWVARKLGDGYSSVAVAKGRIYVTGQFGIDGKLTCLDADGKRLWQVDYGRLPTGKTYYPGARSTPTVSDGRVYVFSALGELSCFDATSGERVWRVDARDRFRRRALTYGLSESVLVDGNTVYCTPGGKAASVVALDAKTGATLWKAPLGAWAAYCSPVLIERGQTRLVVTWLRKAIVGLDAASGELRWEHPIQNRTAIHPNSPLFDPSDGMLYGTCGYGEGGVTLRLSDDGASVTRLREHKRLDVVHGGAVLVGKHVYGSGDQRPRGKWVCLDPRSGEVAWEERGVGKGSVIAAGDRLYCYGERGYLALVEATPERYREHGRVRIKEGRGQHWAHPAISGGRLYVRHGEALVCFDIAAPE